MLEETRQEQAKVLNKRLQRQIRKQIAHVKNDTIDYREFFKNVERCVDNHDAKKRELSTYEDNFV